MYQDAQPFAEGLAAVKAVERWGYITTEGRTAIGYFYQAAAMFSNGVARVIRNGKAYEIDQGGNIVRRLIRRP